MLWGFFKKLVIADYLAIYIAQVYNCPGSYTSIDLLLITYMFGFQIYCDFSGYTDIALGAAQVMGFRLTENFRRPFAARSISDFWHRWHISLSSWIRDYVYFPLLSKSLTNRRLYLANFMAFLLFGIWHGNTWNFVLFGLYFGIVYNLELGTASIRKKISAKIFPSHVPGLQILHAVLQVVIVWHILLISGILFCAHNVHDAFISVYTIFCKFDTRISFNFLNTGTFLFVIAAMLIVFTIDWNPPKRVLQRLATCPVYIRWTIYYTLIFSIIMFGRLTSQSFLYLQF